MADDTLTTVQIDVATRELLRQLAVKNDRSMAAQLRVMVRQAMLETTTEVTTTENATASK